ncbi:MAG: pyridoxal-dependent decarboxylase [Lachnospiraceae bacterium]|nr:pyridoxal-dependent decarboxylase [Lachnospiraceae bacterium]
MKWEDLQTPCYIIHKKELERGIALLKQALADNWKRSIVGYSFKTNALPWALLEMKKAGFYAEVVSEDEYELAERLGFSHIIYNGPIKGRASFLRALQSGAIVNLDAERELDWLEESGLRDVTVGLRVNFDLETVCPGETSAGTEGSRFGFSYEKGAFARALTRLDQMGVPLSGIHLHVGSKTRSVAIYRGLAQMACRLKKEYDLELAYVDLGGGYFGGMDNKPKFPDYMKAIREELSTAFSPEKVTLIVEPGTSLITPPVEYVTEVADCKETYANNIVTIDGSRIDVDPLHRKSSYFHSIVYGHDTPEDARRKAKKQVICGLTCMEDDRLFTLENAPELMPGDRIVFHKVGGYTMCLTPLFIRYFPPVYAEEDGVYTCARGHWGAREYTMGSMIGGDAVYWEEQKKKEHAQK